MKLDFSKDFVRRLNTLFPIRPITRTKKTAIVKFKEIPRLQLYRRGMELGVEVIRKTESVDLLLAIELAVSEDERGQFFCSLCEGKKRFYPTIDELIQEHSYKVLLSWCKANLKKKNYLLMANIGRSTYAEIHTPKQIKKIGLPTAVTAFSIENLFL